MRVHTLQVTGLVTGMLLFAGCEATTEPCGDSAACLAGEPDLSVTEIAVTSSARDAQTGLAVVQPGTIDVHVVVTNDGGGRSDAKPMLLELGAAPSLLVTVPPLARGAAFEGTFRLDPPAQTFLIGTDSMRITATVVTLDAERSNNARATTPFHLALPALRVTARVDSATLRANAGIPASITIENASRYASLPAATLSYCLYELGGKCTQDFRATAFGGLVVPSIGAGQTVTLSHPVAVPSDAAHQNIVTNYLLGSCIAPAEASITAISSTTSCFTVRQVAVRPDYEACDPTALTPGTPAEGTPVCRRPCDIIAFSVRVEPGHTYRVETLTGLEDGTLVWRTRYRDNPVDASPAEGFQPAVAGTYYLVTSPKYCGSAGSRHPVILRDIF